MFHVGTVVELRVGFSVGMSFRQELRGWVSFVFCKRILRGREVPRINSGFDFLFLIVVNEIFLGGMRCDGRNTQKQCEQ